MGFWIRALRKLPADPCIRVAAFTYLSDRWLNYVSCASHVQSTLKAGRRLYVTSLNHASWLHRPASADGRLYFDCVSPSATVGRGLTIDRAFDRAGLLVASATQESLITILHE